MHQIGGVRTGAVMIELGPNLRAVLRGDPLPPEEEGAVDAEVPDFASETGAALRFAQRHRASSLVSELKRCRV